MMPSPRLVEFVRAWEGCSLVPYADVAGKCTIGVGHLVLPGESTDPITEHEAMAMLEKDLDRVGNKVANMLLVDLDQCRFDALCSFAFNLGTQALRDSTLLRLVNMGQYAAAGYEFPKWDKAHVNGVLQAVGGLHARRVAERAMWDVGDYDGRPQ